MKKFVPGVVQIFEGGSKFSSKISSGGGGSIFIKKLVRGGGGNQFGEVCFYHDRPPETL